VTQRFQEPLHPSAKDVLTFDFSPGLANGETLSGVPTLSVAMTLGTDASPSSLLAGGNQLDSSSTMVLVPVSAIGRTEGADYAITCQVATTNPKKQFAITAVLGIRR
jgi:hypothetical protein